MFGLKKEKNYIFYENNKGKIYTVDINSGIIKNEKKQLLKNFPSNFEFALRTENFDKKNFCLIRCLSLIIINNPTKNHNLENYLIELKTADKLDSIGYKSPFRNLEYFRVIHENFKEFLRIYSIDKNLSVEDFVYSIKKENFKKSLNLDKNNEKYGKVINILYKIKNNFSMYELELIGYYLLKGFLLVLEQDDFNENENSVDVSLYSTEKLFKSFFRWSKMIGYTPKKEDFYRQFLIVKKTYVTNLKEYEAQQIIEFYNKKNNIWNFENEFFKVIIPKSSEDFKREAEVLNNCLYSTYLKRVIENKTYIVFIRSKENINEPFIDCEITTDGNIYQFLLKYNKKPHCESLEYQFKQDFQKFINENW